MNKLPPAFLGAAVIVFFGVVWILYANGISWQSVLVCLALAGIGVGRYF